jgi:RNA polymerase sigma factor (sigma-70 family)
LEGCLVHNPAASSIACPFYVSESSALEEYAAGPEHSKWTEDEIAAIRRVLLRLTALRILNPTDAEDLVQDTLLTMLTKYPGSELEKGLLVWSMGILRKKVGNYYRKTQRFSYFSEQDSYDPKLTRELSAMPSPEAKVFHEELQDLVKETLAQLPFDQRQPIELLIAGLNSGEIVKQLYPERYQNVMNRIHRGRKKLAKELAKYGYGPDAKPGMCKMKRCKKK